MSATPTGADAMKDRLTKLLETLRERCAETAENAVAADYGDKAGDRIRAIELDVAVRQFLEAQPAAVAGEAEWHQILVALDLGAQHARWSRDRSRDPREHQLNAQDARKLEVALSAAQRLAAPAAPLVGEPTEQLRKCPLFHGASPSTCISRDGGWDGCAVCGPESASPAAPAGVPTQPNGQLKVAVDLLRVVVGPLEVSAACADEGAEELEALLANVKRCVDQFDRSLLAGNSFHPPACDSSEASGSAIPARPTLPGEDARYIMDHGMLHDVLTGQHLFTEDQHAAAMNGLADEAWSALEAAGIPRDGVRSLGESIRKLAARALLAGGDQKAAPLHPSSVQAVDGDEPVACWLVEKRENGRTVGFLGHRLGTFEWFPTADQATRFVRREDANGVAECFEFEDVILAEHIWG